MARSVGMTAAGAYVLYSWDRDAEHMGKALLLTVVFVPVLVGIAAGKNRRFRRGIRQLVVMTLAFNLAYILVLYYLSYKWL